MKATLVLFFLTIVFVGFARAEENPKAEYVWAEPADEASADNSQSGQAGDAAPGFTVKPIN